MYVCGTLRQLLKPIHTQMAQRIFRSALARLPDKFLRIPCSTKTPLSQYYLSQRTLAIQPSKAEECKADVPLLLSEEDRKDFFRLDGLFKLEEMINARVHLGHKETLLDKHMRPYIFGKRLGVLIFDLEQTSRLLKQALNVAAEIAYRKGIILFIYTSRQSGHLVEDLAKDCGEYAFCRKWRNQVFSNSQKIFGTVTRLPDLVVLFSALNMNNSIHKAVTMSAKLLIPTIAICDTNTDPRIITYPIPGNDDSPQSIEFYCRLFKTAVLNGKTKREEIIDKYGEEFYNKTLESN